MPEHLEEPYFDLLNVYDGFEIRRYYQTVNAVTKIMKKGIEGDSIGFRRIASYIFGKNSLNYTIAMTAPVQVLHNEEYQLMSFTMPSKYDISDLPKPIDESVEIIINPENTVAVLQFSGLAGRRKTDKLVKKLQNKIRIQGLEYSENFTVARYDKPTTLPFNRRNEIWIPIN